MNLDLISDPAIGTHVGERAPVNTFPNRRGFRDKRGLFDASFVERELPLVLFKQLGERQIGIIYRNKGSRNRIFGYERAADNNGRSAGRV